MFAVLENGASRSATDVLEHSCRRRVWLDIAFRGCFIGIRQHERFGAVEGRPNPLGDSTEMCASAQIRQEDEFRTPLQRPSERPILEGP